MSDIAPLTIRPTTPADIPVILELIEGLAAFEKMSDEVIATPARLEATLFGESPDAHCVLGEADGKVVAMAIYFYTYSTFLARKGLHLEDLFVREAFRGRGYGEEMLRHLAGIAVREQCGRYEWTVLDWNQPAINFYQKMGAEILETWRICRVSGEGLHRLARSNDESES